MKISESDKHILKMIRYTYQQLHNDLVILEKKIKELEYDRSEISEKLKTLRLNEIGVINKIEKRHNVKFTADILMEIFKDED